MSGWGDLLIVNGYTAAAAPLIGSAVAAGAARVAEGRAWDFSRSQCSHCGRAIRPLEMIPIISWVAQRGRCRGCAARVSVAYPVIELAAIMVALWAWLAVPAEAFFASCTLGWTLLALSAIDLRTRRLPDVLTAPLAAAGLVTAWLLNPDNLTDHFIGALCGYLSFLLVERAYRHWRKTDGLGRGDAKLLGAIGAWVGWSALPSVVLLSACGAIMFLLVRSRVEREPLTRATVVAFGPFLSGAGWLVWVHGPPIL
jgi:leader peptidase (prepilin peptidase) / N-methyltransferase